MQAHIFVSGQVQGVGYRQYTRWISRKLRVTGWVRNLEDGRVEAVLQGEKDQIEQVLAVLRKGPQLAQVEKIDVRWEEAKDMFEEFVVKNKVISSVPDR